MRNTIISILLLCGCVLAQQPEPSPIFGFNGHTLFPDEAAAHGLHSGVIVNQVSSRSTAFEAGLRRDDVVIEAAGATVVAWEQLARLIIGTGLDNQLEVVVLRDGERVEMAWRVQSDAEYQQGFGTKMLPLRVDSWTGDPVTLESLQGRTVVLVFWRMGLDSAEEVVTMCKDWHESFAEQGLAVVPVHVVFSNFSTFTPESVAEYLAGIELPMSVGSASGEQLARPGDEMSPPLVVTDWQLMSVPTMILIDKQGVVRGNFIYGGQEGFKEGVTGAIGELVAE